VRSNSPITTAMLIICAINNTIPATVMLLMYTFNYKNPIACGNLLEKNFNNNVSETTIFAENFT